MVKWLPVIFVTENRLMWQSNQERNRRRTCWNDTPGLIKMLEIAIKEVTMKRELEKELATALDLLLLPTHLHICATTCVQAYIE